MGRLAESEAAQRTALANLLHNLVGLALNGDARALDWQSIADAVQELDAWGLTEKPYADPIFDRAKRGEAARILELRKRARELLPELRAAYESMTSDRGMPQWPMGDANRIRVPLDKAAALISDLVGEG